MSLTPRSSLRLKRTKISLFRAQVKCPNQRKIKNKRNKMRLKQVEVMKKPKTQRKFIISAEIILFLE
jgi:hypothetical protein